MQPTQHALLEKHADEAETEEHEEEADNAEADVGAEVLLWKKTRLLPPLSSKGTKRHLKNSLVPMSLPWANVLSMCTSCAV
jgi:hypothetical protein